MSDNNEDEVIPKVETENTTIYDRAIILRLEEIIEELKRVNENIDFNNSNITNLREEANNFRDDYEVAQDDLKRTFGMIHNSTSKSSKHLDTISTILVINFVANIIGAFFILSLF